MNEQKFKKEWTEEDWDNLRLSDDFLFGYVMQDKELARIFLESLLDIEIDSVEHIKSQDVLEIAPQFRGVRLDVRLKADGKLVNVEMQTANNHELPHRIRYYQALGDSQLLLRSAEFSDLPEFITIFICTFKPFADELSGKEGLPLYTVTQVVKEQPSLNYDDGRRIMIFNTKAWKKSLAQNQKDMLKYIQDGGRNFKSPLVNSFASQVKHVKTENIFRRNYMTLSLKIREKEMDARAEGREEGLEIGLKKGRAAGRAESQAEISKLKEEIERLKAEIMEKKRAESYRNSGEMA